MVTAAHGARPGVLGAPARAGELTANGTPRASRVGFYAGYNGFKLQHPGAELGAEGYLATTRNFQVVAALGVQGYVQPEVQRGVSLNTRVGPRYTAGWGLFVESGLGVGVQQTSYEATTVDYRSGDPVAEETRAAKTGVVPQASVAVGYDLSRVTSVPLSWYLRGSAGLVYPDQNLAFATFGALQSGLVWVPDLNRHRRVDTTAVGRAEGGGPQ